MNQRDTRADRKEARDRKRWRAAANTRDRAGRRHLRRCLLQRARTPLTEG